MREEYTAVLLRADGSRRTNPEDFQQWLLQAADERWEVVVPDLVFAPAP